MKTTKKTATYVFAGFGGLALICLILWFAGVLKTGEPAPETKPPLGGSAGEVLGL